MSWTDRLNRSISAERAAFVKDQLAASDRSVPAVLPSLGMLQYRRHMCGYFVQSKDTPWSSRPPSIA
jgi:hypothetical protein